MLRDRRTVGLLARSGDRLPFHPRRKGRQRGRLHPERLAVPCLIN